MSKKLLVFILAISSILLLINLGDRFIWTDEAYTAFFASNILRLGFPSTLGKENMFLVKSDGTPFYPFYPSIQGQYVELQPWLPSYLVAFFFYLFGQSFFVLRLPFALAGILVILFLYIFVKKWTNNKRLAVISSLLLSLSVPFYLYSRTARYYSLTMLFSLFILISYYQILKKKRFGTLFFIVSNIALFFTHPAPFFGIYAGVILHFFIFNFNIYTFFRSLIPATVILFFINFPWLLFVNYSSMTEGYNLTVFSSFIGLLNLLVYVFLYFFPFIFATGLPLLIFNKKSRIKLNPFYCLVLLSILFGFFAAAFQPWGFQIPLRYIISSLPLFMILLAGIILQLAAVSKFIAFIVVFFLVFTNFLYIFPFKLAEDLLLDNIASTDAKLFVEDNLQVRYLLRDFIYEITHHYSTPNENIINFIKSNGGKSTDVLLTNYDLNVMLYASGMRLYQKGIIDEKPDWIVLRKPASYPEPYNYAYAKQFITPEYEKFVLNTSDYRYQLDEPHPRTHRFRELGQPIVSLQYPHEADSIEIYKLKK